MRIVLRQKKMVPAPVIGTQLNGKFPDVAGLPGVGDPVVLRTWTMAMHMASDVAYLRPDSVLPTRLHHGMALELSGRGAGKGVAVVRSPRFREQTVQLAADLVRQIRTNCRNYRFQTEIIVAGVRRPIHVLEAALAGAEICTMRFDVLRQLYRHLLTDMGIEMFPNDWKKVPGS